MMRGIRTGLLVALGWMMVLLIALLISLAWSSATQEYIAGRTIWVTAFLLGACILAGGVYRTARTVLASSVASRRWRPVAIGTAIALLPVLGAYLVLRPSPVNASAPVITTYPEGILIAFDRGAWSRTVVSVNRVYSCDIGELGPGQHIIAWNRFQGPASAPLNQTLVTNVLLRGEVQGRPREIDCAVQMGSDFVATSYIQVESIK